MIETIRGPRGMAETVHIITCDGCGEPIDCCGSMCESDDGGRMLHFCDSCSSPANQEFRVCDRCGNVMTEGFCNDSDHICEECWDKFTVEEFPYGFRETPEDEYDEDDDYYQACTEDGEWYVVGWYWTQWY